MYTHTQRFSQDPYGINSVSDLNSCHNPIKSNLGILAKFPDLTHTRTHTRCTLFKPQSKWAGTKENVHRKKSFFYCEPLYFRCNRNDGEAGNLLSVSTKNPTLTAIYLTIFWTNKSFHRKCGRVFFFSFFPFLYQLPLHNLIKIL